MPLNAKDCQPPHAIVIGLDCMTGLQTARIMAGHKVPVIGIARNPKHPCCRTNVCEEIIFADTAGQELVGVLEAFGPRLKQKAVLVPCTDMSVLAISRHREKLTGWYHVVLPEPGVVEMLVDKIKFHAYAQEKGFPVPSTFFLRTRAEAEQAAKDLTFPCILKPPLKTPTWEKHTKAKAFKASSPDELLALYDRCSEWADVLMAQEWIEGSDASLYSCNCYFNAESRPLVTFVARKLRQWPPVMGTSCLGEECRNDYVLQETVRLFGGVGFSGLGYVEMKRDERSGKHFIIEPNVGRPTGRSAIAEAAGVELLYAMYCDTVGWPLPANLEQKYGGVKWIYFRRDLQSALHYWRRGDLTLREWWRSWRGRKSDALFSWTDPVPFFADLWKALAALFTRTRNGREEPNKRNVPGEKARATDRIS